MTPIEFQRAMKKACASDDFAAVRKQGIALVNRALGDYSELYLGAVEDWFDRLRALKNEKASFSSPTRASIEQAARDAGMESEVL